MTSEVRLYRFLPDERRQRFVAMLARLQTPAPGLSISVDATGAELDAFLRRAYGTFHEIQIEVLHEIVDLERRLRILNKRAAGAMELTRWNWALRKLADTIAWFVIGLDNLWIARRLCKHGTGSAALTSVAESNFESVERFVSRHNRDQPDAFALISDITSFVHLGDGLVRERTKLRIVELKEGKVNAMLLDQLDAGASPEALRENLIRSQKPQIVSQLDRMMRQELRAKNTASLINTGHGVDQHGRETTISDSTFSLETYADVLAAMFDRLKTSSWAIEHLDGCLYLGLYKGPMRSPYVFGSWLRDVNFDGPIVNYLDSMRNPLATPPMLTPVVAEYVESLLTGEVVLQMALDIEKFLALGVTIGLPMRWMTKKETNAAAQHGIGKDIFTWKKRSISLGRMHGPIDMNLGWGVLGLGGHPKPASRGHLKTGQSEQ